MADSTPNDRSKALSMGEVFERLERRIEACEEKHSEDLDESEQRLLNQYVEMLALNGLTTGRILANVDLQDAERYLDILYHLGSYESPALLFLFVTTFDVIEDTIRIEWDQNVFDGKWQKVKCSKSLVKSLERQAKEHNIVDKLKENKWEKKLDRTREQEAKSKETAPDDANPKKRGLRQRLGLTQEKR